MFSLKIKGSFIKYSYNDIVGALLMLSITIFGLYFMIFQTPESSVNNQYLFLEFCSPFVLIAFIISIYYLIRISKDLFSPLQDYKGKIRFLRSYVRYTRYTTYVDYFVYLVDIKQGFMIDKNTYFYLKEGDIIEISFYTGSRRVQTTTIQRDTPIEPISDDQIRQMQNDQGMDDVPRNFTSIIGLFFKFILGLILLSIFCFILAIFIKVVSDLNNSKYSLNNNTSSSSSNSYYSRSSSSFSTNYPYYYNSSRSYSSYYRYINQSSYRSYNSLQ